MAQHYSYPTIATLRAITYRLTTTQPDHLPQLASQLSGSIWNCRTLLSASSDSLGSKNDAATLVHRFKSRIGVLLQDRTVEGRWAGTVLCKAAIEAGGVESLSKSNPWVRSLLAILKKNDPSTTRYLAVLTLTRIFMLTWERTNLIREITTPALPTFVSTCISNAQKSRCWSKELQAILEAFTTLLPKHPTIFRTHETQIKSLIAQVLASDAHDRTRSLQPTNEHRETALYLLVLLHHCAPKQGSSEAWDKSFQAAITAAHSTCDRLFRGLIEDWKSSTGIERASNAPLLASSEAEQVGDDALGLPGWHGVLAGHDRLIALLGVLRSHLVCSTSANVSVRLGQLVDLVTRVMGVTVPASADLIKTNPQISKDEREALFATTPSIHVATIALVFTLLKRFDQASAPFALNLLEQLTDVFRAELFDDNVRAACYECLDRILQLFGRSLPKQVVADLALMIRTCCNDLFPADDHHGSSRSGANGSIESVTVSSKGASSSTMTSRPSTSLNQSASDLLASFITYINAAHLPRKLRTQIERTAVLTRNKEALLACVMNPARTETREKLQTSLLPLLAQEFPDSLELEALVRPRMPPIILERTAENGVEEEEEEEEEEQDDDVMDVDHSKAVVSEELYATTPPPPPEVARNQATEEVDTETSAFAAKRHAELDLNGPAKRTRSSSDANPQGSESQSAPSTLDAVASQTRDTPTAVNVVVPNPETSNAAGNSVSTGVVPVPRKAATVGDSGMETMDSDDDGSDFEMPPLTMEPSDDEEVEDED